MDRRVIGAMIGHGVKPEEVEDKLFLDTAEKDLARETSCSTFVPISDRGSGEIGPGG